MMQCDCCKHEVPREAPVPRQSSAEMIRAMKMRAGIETDTELAAFVSRSPSAVAQWRRKDTVPEAALVRFETRMRALGK